ncbi:MAG TPA: NAD(P)-binding domain-containing protein, partial [Burkholderiales bacterium]|nr:NAD(P)-binding domain-containing protein [Burkholderiales bacterium]
MKLGYVGVGKMGGPMAERLLAAGNELVVFDTRAAAVDSFVARGAR